MGRGRSARARTASTSVEHSREPAAVRRRQRMLLAEFLEDRHHQLPNPLATIRVGRPNLVEQLLQSTIMVARLERRDQLGLLATLSEVFEQPLTRRRARQRLEEATHGLTGLSTDELGHDLAVP